MEQGLIDIELVDRLIHKTVIYFGDRTVPVWKYGRKEQPPEEHPFYDSAEYLYNLIKDRSQQQEASRVTQTQATATT